MTRQIHNKINQGIAKATTRVTVPWLQKGTVFTLYLVTKNQMWGIHCKYWFGQEKNLFLPKITNKSQKQ